MAPPAAHARGHRAHDAGRPRGALLLRSRALCRTAGAYLPHAHEPLVSIVPPSARAGARGGLALAYAAYHQDGLLFWSALIALISGSLVPYIRAKAESLGLGASVGLAPREARLVLFLLGVAAWAVTANSSFFAVAVAVVALLSTITVVQRLSHVAAA